MACVTGLLPVEQGVAAWAALRRDAEAIKAAGDDRGLGQLMADLFVERLTGQRCADEVPVEVQLVMDPEALLGTGDIRPPCPDTAPFPPPSRVSWSSARARRPAAPAIPAATATPAATVRRTGRGRARGCAGSSPTRRGAWSPSIPTDGTSRPPCVDSRARPGRGLPLPLMRCTADPPRRSRHRRGPRRPDQRRQRPGPVRPAQPRPRRAPAGGPARWAKGRHRTSRP